MKSILIFTFVLATYLSVAQSQVPKIKKHYHVMDSLWNKDDYTGLINYCKANENFFKQNNTYPLYDYYRFLTEYLGEAYTENGEYDEAEKTFEASRAGIIKEIFGAKMHPAYWDVLQEMGYMYRVSGRFTKAYTVYTEAWKVAEFWRRSRWWKYIKLADNLINICTSIGKYDDAEYYAGKVEKSIPQANYTKDQLLDHYIVLAVFYTQILAVQKAELYIQKASDLLPKTAFNIFTKVELNNVQAMALMASGRKDTAEKVLVELLGMLDKLKMKNTDSYYLATGNLASVFLVNSHTKEADSILNNTLSNPGKTKSKYFGALYLNLALVNAQGAAYEKALANIDSALMIFSAQAKDEAQFNLPAKILRSAFLLKLNRKEEAYVVYNNVMQWYINYIRENVVHLSESEKNSLLMSYFNMANFAASFLVAADGQVSNDIVRKIWEQQLFFNGLAAGEQTKLYSLLRQNKDTALQNLFAEWRELRHFLYAESQKSAILQNRNLANIALLAEKKEKQLMLYLPGAKADDNINTVEKIYKSLLPGEAVVAFSHYMYIGNTLSDSLWYGAYILNYGNPEPVFINLCSENRVNAFFEGQGFVYPSTILNSKHNQLADTLYTLIWKPVQKQLRNIKTVFIVADGIMHKIAFHALPLQTGGYLSDKIDIRYLYNCNSISDNGFRTEMKYSGVQLWGGMNYDTGQVKPGTNKEKLNNAKRKDTSYSAASEKDWEYLRGTAREVESIRNICVSNKIRYQLFMSNNASEKSFKQNFGSGYDIVHIATHGRFEADYYLQKPEYSLYTNLPFTITKNPMQKVSLVMAGRNNLKIVNDSAKQEDDGLLSASEITQLNAGTKKLVVLTACESGGGDVINSEGVFGMVRAFKMAGTDKLIISLWEVPDEQSIEMTNVFYKSLFRGQSIDKAFKFAQQYMKKRYTPFYWGGFMLVE